MLSLCLSLYISIGCRSNYRTFVFINIQIMFCIVLTARSFSYCYRRSQFFIQKICSTFAHCTLHSSFIRFCIIRLIIIIIFVQLPVHNVINGKMFAFSNSCNRTRTYLKSFINWSHPKGELMH